MGMIERLMELVFGNGRNLIGETAEVFRANAESDAARAAALREAALAQFASEFELPKESAFNRFMDGLNRLPRPLLALGTIGLFVSAMVEPVWFAARMQGIALVPEPLWWLLGAVISFYFGARHQAKGQELQRQLAATLARAPYVAQNIEALEAGSSFVRRADVAPDAQLEMDVSRPDHNSALNAWQASANAGR